MATQNKSIYLFKIRFIFCLLVLLLISTSLMAKITVEGRAMVELPEGNYEYEGIKIYFFDNEFKIIADTTFTDENGYYELKLKYGSYDIFYKKGKYVYELNNIKLLPIIFKKKHKIDDIILNKVKDDKISLKYVSNRYENIKYPFEIELLKSIGRDLKSFSTLTYLGFGISIIGTTIAVSSDGGGKKIGIGISVIGGIISLTAPAKVGSAGEKLQEFAKYKYLEQQKNKTDKNKVKD